MNCCPGRKRRACPTCSSWTCCWEHKPMPAASAGWRAAFEKHILQRTGPWRDSTGSSIPRLSTGVVTNVDFGKWEEYLADVPRAMAFLDRLVERAIVLKVTGKSYRAWLAQQAAEAEAAKKDKK